MAFKQPRVPEYRESEGVERYIKSLILFLKDFCTDAWMASGGQAKSLDKAQAENAGAYVRKAGDEMTGALRTPGLEIGSETEVLAVRFLRSGGHAAHVAFDDAQDQRRFIFDQTPEASEAAGEAYRLPACDAGRTQAGSFDILTSKRPVSIEQGGTGASTPEAARAALGVPVAAEILLAAHPVGCIYQSLDATSPAAIFGGTWEQFVDRFLVGAGASYAAGSWGGEAYHTLSVYEMPSHNHGARGVNSGTSSSTVVGLYPFDIEQDRADNWGVTSSMIANTGGNGAHNNLPPYLAVYMWRRVS